jgi:NADH dehydrogenase FAD-containing subunit
MNTSAHDVIATHFDKFKKLTMIHGCRVNHITGSKVVSNNLEIECDCVIVCTGLKPNTSFVSSNIRDDLLDSKGFVKVNHFLQNAKYQHIFAVGDVTSIVEQKMYALGIRHSRFLPNCLSGLVLKENVVKYQSISKGVLLYLGVEKAVLLKNDKVYFESSLFSSIIRLGETAKANHVAL